MATVSDTLRSAKKDSVWSATAKMPECPPLAQDVKADVCIVGGGIAGLTTAYLLGKRGKSVVLVDDGSLAGGMTTVTTAHLSNAIDDRFFEIARWHGEDAAKLAAESHTAAIYQVEQIVHELKINCDFTRLDGFLFLAPGDEPEMIDRELAAARRAGLTKVEKVARAPIEQFDTGPCLRFPDQARFHPLKYLAAVAKAIEKQGGKLYTKSHADRIDGGEDAHVEVGSHSVRAKAIVVATNAPINDLVAIHTKQAPYMTYVIGARVPRGAVTDALYWDTQKFYHYVRLQPFEGDADSDGASGYELLIVGGEDHKSGQADDASQRHARLETWARARFPIEDIVFTWGGQCMLTVDGLAFIGRNPLDKDNVYVATGDSGMGMTHGTIAGILLTDLITGRENPWAQLYDPSRKTVKSTSRFLKENVNTAAQYAKWLTPGDVTSIGEIKAGSGAVLRRGMSKVAVYRDPRGKPHEMSAVCPHLGCIVKWNDAESSWDCPCHGSRFDPLGKVLNGPANSDLPPVED
jgi:glycine/D-amino acid oxidase-like deaminating enzyme/nitrite reductase/ring-hydroxylating ferredoxin subunit